MAKVSVRSVGLEGVQLVGVVALEGHDGAEVEVRFSKHADGSMPADRLTIHTAPGAEVDARLLKAVQVPAIRAAVVAEFNRTAGLWLDTADGEASRSAKLAAVEALRALVTPRTPGKWTDDVLHAFAVEALSAQGSGASRHAHMAQWLRKNGHPKADEVTSRDVTYKARKRGFFAPVSTNGKRELLPGPMLKLRAHMSDTPTDTPAAKATTPKGNHR
jgi:hypothetical protein